MLGSVTAEHIPHNQISNYIENGADRSYVNHKTAQVGRIPFTRFLHHTEHITKIGTGSHFYVFIDIAKRLPPF